MQEARGFKKLICWQKAYYLALMIYRLTKRFPKSEIYGLSLQLRRAAVSVPANIAEGNERRHKKEHLQFLAIARGSLSEIETYLQLAQDLKYLTETEYEKVNNLRVEVGKLLRGLMKSLS